MVEPGFNHNHFKSRACALRVKLHCLPHPTVEITNLYLTQQLRGDLDVVTSFRGYTDCSA